MTAPIHVVVPVKNRWDLTEQLVAQVTAEPIERLWVLDNGSTDGTPQNLSRIPDPRITVVPMPDAGIYRMWNTGWLNALAHSTPVAVAIVNNDITLPPDALTTMRDALYSDGNLWAVYPDWSRTVAEGSAYTGQITRTTGTYQNGGMSGWCFMLKGEAHLAGLPLVDEGYEWWYGDDFLADEIVASGHGVGRLDGLPLDHVTEATAAGEGWTVEAKARDQRRWDQRHGRVA